MGNLLRRFKIELLCLGVMAASLLLVMYLSTQRVSLQQQARMSLFPSLNLGNKTSTGQIEKTSGTPTEQPGQNSSLTKNQVIAKNTLSWLSNKKDSRGIYYLSCNNATCDKPMLGGDSGHAGLSIIWGRFMSYQKTKDATMLTALASDMENYSNQNKIPYIQNQGWNCKLHYEIYKSSIVSQEIKKKAESLCFVRSLYRTLDTADFNEQKTKTNLNNVLNKKIELVMKPNATESLVNNYYGYYASDFVYKYLWKDNKNYLVKAKMFFDLGLRAYTRTNSMTSDAKCAVGEAAVDLYKVTQEQNYLDFAKTVYKGSFSGLSPVCIYFADSLDGATGDNSYALAKEQALSSVIKGNQYFTDSLSNIGLLVGIANR